jgi:hypothetical protein
MLDHSCQVQRHPHAERGEDLYETPRVATETLLLVERVPRRVLEPACGRGAIVNVLRQRGHDVVACDLIDYGHGFDTADFLKMKRMPEGVRCIVTNPPFKIAEAFISHALDICPLLIVLLRLAFLEAGTGKQKKHRLRARVLDEIPPARIHVFDRRLPMFHRDGWQGRKANSGMSFAWWVWDRNHTGPITIDRISWWRR